MTLIDFVFPKLRTPKTWSDKFPKSPVSEDPSTSQMVNVPKRFPNLRQSTFMIFIDHCQVNWVGKPHSYWHAKSWDCLLTYCLPMKIILFLKDTNKRYEFRCSYLRNEKLFLKFLLDFWNLQKSFKYFENKDDPHRFCISEITDSQNVVR